MINEVTTQLGNLFILSQKSCCLQLLDHVCVPPVHNLQTSLNEINLLYRIIITFKGLYGLLASIHGLLTTLVLLYSVYTVSLLALHTLQYIKYYTSPHLSEFETDQLMKLAKGMVHGTLNESSVHISFIIRSIACQG